MKYPLLLLLSVLALSSFSQCPAGEASLEISITPDGWPDEINWDVQNSLGQVIESGDYEGGGVCLTEGECFVFTIYDEFGDGIFEPGGYVVYLNGDSIAGGGTNYDDQMSHFLNCADGALCQSAQQTSV